MMASTRSGGRVQLCSACVGLQMRSYGGLVIALLVVVCTMVDVHCITASPVSQVPPPPTEQNPPNFVSFDADEADTLNAIFQNWTALNPQLTTNLNWTSPSPHPCDVTSTVIECDFNGITGVLPSTISRLLNLDSLTIDHNPNLTGTVPMEIWRMPNLTFLSLQYNSLVGTVPSNDINASSNLQGIQLNNNNFSGSLQLGPDGTLFGSSLQSLDLSKNNLYGSVNFANNPWISSLGYLNISYNDFNDTFFNGPYFDPQVLDLSNNYFKNITFDIYNH